MNTWLVVGCSSFGNSLFETDSSATTVVFVHLMIPFTMESIIPNLTSASDGGLPVGDYTCQRLGGGV